MNPHIAKIMADDGIAGVTALMAEQRGRGIAVGGEAEGAAAGTGSGGENGQAAGTDAAKSNGRA